MSRTGPAYVETESELVADLERKESNGEISEKTANAFIELYEFAKELDGEVTIGKAKNANFQFKLAAHQGEYRGDPSVFTANVNSEVQIWPARMAIDNDAVDDSVAWDAEDYDTYERKFQSLRGVPQAPAVQFECLASSGDLDGFKTIVEEFVGVCQQKAEESAN